MTEETRQVLVMPDPGSGPGQARSGIQSSIMHDCLNKSLILGITTYFKINHNRNEITSRLVGNPTNIQATGKASEFKKHSFLAGEIPCSLTLKALIKSLENKHLNP